MTDKYADLRAALADGWVQSIHPDTARDLLAERDRFFFALQEISHPEAVRGDATKIARAALAQENQDD